MKILFNLFLMSILIFLFAFKASAEETYKIGAINAIRVLEKSPQADIARKMIEDEFSLRDKELITQQKSIKELEDKFKKDRAILSEEENAKLERDIISKKRDLKRKQDEFREDLNYRRNEEMIKIQKQIIQSIQKVAKDNEYDLVLSEGVLYASPKIDMSGLVIDYLKKENQ
jgi:outer membrane protein